jgi:TolB protein
MRRIVLLGWVALLAIAACGEPAPSRNPVPSAIVGPSPVTSGEPSATSPSASTALTGPIASSGSIAIRAADGSLSIVGADGRSTPLADVANGTFGFPTWSPDGTQIATVRARPTSGADLVVFDTAAGSADPVVILSDEAIEPFYLFWTPDSRSVTFLATEADALSLRIAPSDGSAPLDGTGPGAKIRTGNPLYYDWIGQDRLLAHIGTGPEAFLGEIGLDGDAVTDALAEPGEFRSAVVNRDGTVIAFVRGADRADSSIVLASREGSNEHELPVFGPSAMAFDAAGTTLATIGPHEPVPPDVGFPVGPLRLIDVASGEVRTLVDGFVVGFWWSPDGRTIAALRVQPAVGSASPSGGVPSPAEQERVVSLLFVDVRSGETQSQPIVTPGQRFIETQLAFFDQYALSHHLWAPDSSSMLLPETGPDGLTHIAIRFVDGKDPIFLDGESAFWSP